MHMRKALPAFRGTFRCTINKDMLGENNKMIKQAFRPVNFSFISVAEICFIVKTLRNIKSNYNIFFQINKNAWRTTNMCMASRHSL